jgi:GDP-L-fucose synthase
MSIPDRGYWLQRDVVTGGNGFVGTAVVRDLESLGASVCVIRSHDHDLRVMAQARAAVDGADTVIHLAASVGGIGFNRRNPAILAYDNMMMAANIFEQCRLAGVRELVAA